MADDLENSDENPRFAYHGTAADNVESILEDGLHPRGSSEPNHDEMASHPAHVYLTSLYALHYGVQATGHNEPFAVVEVDLERLDKSDLYPDEDFLEGAAREDEVDVEIPHSLRCRLPEQLDAFRERTRIFRDEIEKFADQWRQSLSLYATCSYRGVVPPSTIRRVAVVDPAPEFHEVAANAEMGIRNVPVFGDKHRLLTEWVFDGDVTVEEYVDAASVFTDPSEERRREIERLFSETEREVYRPDC